MSLQKLIMGDYCNIFAKHQLINPEIAKPLG